MPVWVCRSGCAIFGPRFKLGALEHRNVPWVKCPCKIQVYVYIYNPVRWKVQRSIYYAVQISDKFLPQYSRMKSCSRWKILGGFVLRNDIPVFRPFKKYCTMSCKRTHKLQTNNLYVCVSNFQLISNTFPPSYHIKMMIIKSLQLQPEAGQLFNIWIC